MGLEALRIADAAQESLRTGVPVHLDQRFEAVSERRRR
jgi:hypothetical protein